MDASDVARRHGASILRRCRAILGDEEEARDALQDVLVQVLTKGHRFRGDAEVSTWLYRVSTNVCLNRLRGGERRTAREEAAPWAGQPALDPLSAYAQRREIRGLLERFDALDQAIIVHHYLDGMTQAEIAEVTRRSRRTVGKRMRRLEATLASMKDEVSGER